MNAWKSIAIIHVEKRRLPLESYAEAEARVKADPNTPMEIKEALMGGTALFLTGLAFAVLWGCL